MTLLSGRAIWIVGSLILAVAVALPVHTRAALTTVSYTLEVGDIWGMDLWTSETTAGQLVIDFAADDAGNVLPGPVTIQAFELAFSFDGWKNDFEDRYVGVAAMSLTGPFTGWALDGAGNLDTPITQDFLDLFFGTTDLERTPVGPLVLDITPTAAFFSFRNGGPFVAGALGGAIELEAGFDLWLAGDGAIAIVDFDFMGEGHEALRTFSAAPEPSASVLMLLGIAGAVSARGLTRARTRNSGACEPPM